MSDSSIMIRLRKTPEYLRVFTQYGWLKNHPILETVPDKLKMKVLSRVAISRADGFCYFRVPKVANSTIVKSLLLNSMPNESSSISGMTAKRMLHGIPMMPELENLFVFTVVRHPVSRTLSAYLDKSHQDDYRKKHLCLRVEAGEPSGFERFLDGLKDGQLMDNIHWAPQSAILPYDLEKYDHIGRFETLHEDLDHCLHAIFGKNALTQRSDPHRTGASDKVSEFVGSKQRAIIEKLYHDDFNNFYPNG